MRRIPPLLGLFWSLIAFAEGGKWIEVDVTYNYKNGYEFGHEPIDRKFLRGEVKACQSMEVLILDSSSLSNYVFYQLYYYYSYTAILDGGSYKKWKYGKVLDCYTWKPFWFAWDGTTHSMGMGLEPGQNLYLTHNFGRTINMNVLKIAAGQSSVSGKWRWLEDDPPLFVMPEPDGDKVIEISESTAKGSVVYTPEGTDKENDVITFSTTDQNTDYFKVDSGKTTLLKELDYETKTEHLVTYKAQCEYNYAKTTLLVNVKNEFDVTPVITVHTLKIPEELRVGSDIGKAFSVVDDEEGDSLTFSLSGSHQEYLNLDASTGVLTIKKEMDVDTTNFDFTGLTFTATDAGGNSASKAFSLTVYDVNDNMPMFSKEYNEVTVDDGTSSGVVIELGLSDADSTNQGHTRTILSQNGDTSNFKFSISYNRISAKSTLDYESLANNNFRYVLTVRADDKPTYGDKMSSTTCVVVKINPVNEHTPTWTTTPSGASVSEDAVTFTLITTIKATDSDLGDDGRISYKIESVSPNSGAGLFTVDLGTGKVKVGGHLDYDTGTAGVTSYTVTVAAVDNGGTPRKITADISVTLNGVNDNAPFFDEDIEYVANDVLEGVTGVLLQPVVTDHDGSTVTLSIVSGNDGGHFSISGDSLMIVSALDYETNPRHSLVIRASDSVHTTDIAVTINVKDVIDEAPVIETVESTSMAEEQPIGTHVSGGFTVKELEASDTLHYGITGGESSYLKIDSNTGELTVAKNVDYESGIRQLTFTLIVEGTNSNKATKSITISVVDINDNFPKFNPSVYTVEVTENTAADVSLLEVTCTDSDTGTFGQFDLSIDTNSGDGGKGMFKLVGNQFRTAKIIDYESLALSNFMYNVIIHATDQHSLGAFNTGSAVIRVIVKPENEFTPTWTAPNYDSQSMNFDGVTVSEGAAPGTLITTFQASDADLGLDGVMYYEVISAVGESGASQHTMFSVDPSTGKFTVSGPLDVDAGTNGEAYYNVVLRATDSGTQKKKSDGSIRVTLSNVNDNPPYFDQIDYSADVQEDATAQTVVITLATGDFDADTVTLSMVSGPASLFEVAGHSIKVKGALDFETSKVHVLTIRANDGKFDTDVPVTINVRDVIDEPPVINMVASATMSEEQAMNTGVYGGYIVTDPDAGDTLVYSLTGADSSYLTIDSSTGELFMAENVNREMTGGKTKLDLTLTVTDQAGLQATKDFSIAVKDINDLSPVFNPSVFTAVITENSAADIALVDLTCADNDLGDNALFDVTVASGDGGAGIFKMSGLQLKTDSTPANYEALESSGFMYTLVITATDKSTFWEPKTGTAIVKVTVKPQNEFTPVWNNTVDGSGFFDPATVSEGDAPGHIIRSFKATDSDLGDDGVVRYSIVSVTGGSGATPTDKFSIDSSTGNLMVGGALDVDAGTNGETNYTIVIRASDSGTSPLTVDGKIVVSLTDINDNAPTFDKTDYSANVSEAVTPGKVVITLKTYDYDTGDTVTLSIVSGGDGLFKIVGHDVETKAGLDYETSTFHILTIRASDGRYHTDVPLTIFVLDASDEVPVITLVSSATLSEAQAFGTGVYGGYIATDADAGDTLTYSLSGQDSSYLTVNSTTGRLFIADHVDREGNNAKTQLNLKLTVTDGVLSDSKDFTIAVEDINDSPSIFNPSEYSVEVTENTGPDVSLLNLTCSDVDTGNNALFDVAVAGGNAATNTFKMSGLTFKTGSVRTDYEAVKTAGHLYTVLVTAVDRPDQGVPNTATAIIRVTVKPVNEHSPLWTQPTETGSGIFAGVNTNEDSPPGTLLVTFQASDEDDGDDGVITYSIVSVTSDTTGANLNEIFNMDPVTGELTVGGKLDSDVNIGGHASYTVVVRATDNGGTPNKVDGTIIITPNNVNDNPTTFSANQYQVNISESTSVGTGILTLTTEDHDGDTPTFSLVGGRSDLFEMDGNHIKVKAGLDYETDIKHVVVVRANEGKHNTDVSVEIKVTDEIDEVPVITMITTSSLSEEQAINTAVFGGYVVTDADEGDVLNYALSGADAAYFTIDSATGQLTVAQNINREAGLTSLSLTLHVRDKASNEANQAFTITIEDINDQPPVFNPERYSVVVSENTAAGTSVIDLQCQDSDVGNNAKFNLSVFHGDDASAKFKFVGLQLQTTNIPLDYDTADLRAKHYTYTLVVTAVDTPDQGDPITAVAIVTVKVKPVNEDTPTWTAPDSSGTFAGISVDESTIPGTVITTFQASESDHGDDGLIQYSIVSVKGDTSGKSLLDLFSIDPSTGELAVAADLDSDLDTGGEASYSLIVRASDGGTTPNTIDGTITVTPNNVNDNAPVFTKTKFQANVTEDSTAGTVAITIDTKDHDGDTVTLTIVSGRDDLFEIDGSDVKVKGTLDFETKTYYLFILKATDGKFEARVGLQINVVDVVDEEPVITMVTSSSIPEELPIGTVACGGYSVTDPDASDVLTYTLSGADSDYLSIGVNKGEITVAKNIDREGVNARTSLSLTLTVTDQASLKATKNFTIAVTDINDLTPVFSPDVYTVTVTENTAKDTEIVKLNCSDGDTGNNAAFNMAILTGDDTAKKFKMTGSKILTNVNNLDFETSKEYTLIITSVDTPDHGTSNTGTAVVKVSVKPENEDKPTWTAPDSSGRFEVTIAENTQPGSILTTYAATDNDDGIDGDVTYKLVSVTSPSGTVANDLIAVDKFTGEVFVAKALDVDTGTNGEPSYTVVISAVDGGTPSKSVEGELGITLTNVNDNAPTFNQVSYQVDVNESTTVGTAVITLTTEDHDSGDTVTLSIASGRTDLFECDGHEIKLKAALDFEKEKFYVLIIRATDGTYETDVPLHIDVKDVIDEAPVITKISTPSIAEEMPKGTPIYGGYSVSDPDVTDVLIYSISGADSNYVTIDTSTGLLSVAVPVDREGTNAKTNLSLTVTVTDQAGLQAALEVSIDVEDVNDQTPTFAKRIYQVTVTENTAPYTDLLDFVCSDGDTGNNGVFNMSILSGDDATPKFKMVGTKLQTETNPLDYETVKNYLLFIIAVDAPDEGAPQTGTTLVKVTVSKENEFTPSWTAPSDDGSGNFDGITVDENVGLGYVVTTFQAADSDDSNDGVVSYSIDDVTGDTTGANLSTHFSMDASTGKLMVAHRLDSDISTGGETSYTVIVRATDKGSSQKTLSGKIVITPKNVNDNAPEFLQPKFMVNVNETTSVGTSIIKLDTEDADGDTITWSILQGRDDLFELDGNDVKVKAALDYEDEKGYLLHIKASDGTFDTVVSLKVNLVDVFDEPPVITIVSAGKMSEGQPIGTAVTGGFKVSDPDAGEQIQDLLYELSGADSHYLTIRSNSGLLTVNKHIDRDGANGIKELKDLKLTVTDQASLQSTQTFTIEVLDVNDLTPTFNPSEYVAEVTENSVSGTPLVNLTCSDGDEGNNALFNISIGGGDDATPKFKMVDTQLETTPNPIDYDTMTFDTYILYIIATDKPDQGDPNTGTAIVMVTVKPVNEHTPVWSGPTNDGAGSFKSILVSEALAPAEGITTFSATDADRGADGDITYTIVSVTGETSGNSLSSMFSIDASTGQLKVSGKLDRDLSTGGETNYIVVVRASDGGTTPKTVDGTIKVTPENINDNAPYFNSSEFSANINEDAAAGTVVTTLGTHDPDGDSVTLSIVSGPGDIFEMDGNEIKIKSKTDFETDQVLVLVVKVTDGKYETNVSVEITVGNVVDEPPVITIVATPVISEEQAINTGVYGGYVVTDPDVGDTLTYSLSGSDSSYFTIDSATGQLTLVKRVERDGANGKKQLSLVLTVKDSQGNEVSKDIIINVVDVNDLAPFCDPSIFNAEVAENSPADMALLNLTCTDNDEGNNAEFNVSIGSGDDTVPKFKMVKKQLLTTSNPIDYETLSSTGYLFTLVLIAVDTPDQGQANTGTAIVKVKVTPVNEHTPVWRGNVPDSNGSLPDVTVAEDSAPGTVITSVTATDSDLSDDGEVAYEITSITLDNGSDATGTFVISAETGELQVRRSLDAESSVYYDVSIRAFDGGNPVKNNTLNIKVYVTNVNDMAPSFSKDKYTVDVPEDTAIDATFYTLTATDPDGDMLSFAVDGDGSDMFECRGNSTVLLKKLDYETDRYHSLIVNASDGIHVVAVSVIINVQNVMDEPPTITVTSDYSMPEGLLIGTALGDVFTVEDADAGDVFEFQLSGANADKLDINKTTGVLSIRTPIDGDGGVNVLDQVKVTVTDQGGQSDSADLNLTIINVNDNAPKFTNLSHEVTIDENGSGEQALVNFTVTDADAGADGEFDLSILSGDDPVNPIFSLRHSVLYVDSSKVDYERLTGADYRYTVTVGAKDKPTKGQALSSSSLVTVKVTSKNEFPPKWVDPLTDANKKFPDVTVPELTDLGSRVANFTASDEDAGLDGDIVYRIQSITDNYGNKTDTAFGMLNIDLVGHVILSTELDADNDTGGVQYYELVITASDNAVVPQMITGTVTIHVMDEYDPEPTETISETDAETWALRGSLMVVGTGLGIGGLMLAKNAMNKGCGKKPSSKLKPKLERHRAHDEELTIHDLDDMVVRSIVEPGMKIRPPR